MPSFALLTLQKVALKSNGKVSRLPANLYAQWREQAFAAGTLRETEEGVPSERLLQQIWRHQRLRRDQLKTLDGTTVRVLHPGFWNREPGPDFLRAILQWGGEAPRSGDVEVDLRTAGWRGHGHDRNPAYRNVILHVVWDAGTNGACELPTLALKTRLDASLEELRIWLGHDAGVPGGLQGRCTAPLRDIAGGEIEELLRQAALVRLRRKAYAFGARARQIGWEQTLWEGLFTALGYKHNIWAMRRVAELLPALLAAHGRKRADALAMQARLLGISGLLPTELTRGHAGADGYLRRVWDHWWREREEFAECVLPRGIWRFGGLRPANHPQRRLALAAHWLAAGDLPGRMERWFTAEIPDRELESSLRETLQAPLDEFWSWHWTLRSDRLSGPRPLLGARRVTDVAVNVVLPWFWMRANAGRSDPMRETAEHRYFSWPKGEDNAVLRLARQRLLGGTRADWLCSASLQQGLLQIVRDYCEHSNALCDQCQFPELVRSLHRAAEARGR